MRVFETSSDVCAFLRRSTLSASIGAELRELELRGNAIELCSSRKMQVPGL